MGLMIRSGIALKTNLIYTTKSLTKIYKHRVFHNSWQHKSKGLNKKEKDFLPSELLPTKTSDFNNLDQLHYFFRKSSRFVKQATQQNLSYSRSKIVSAQGKSSSQYVSERKEAFHNSWQHKLKGLNKKEKDLLPSELLPTKIFDFNNLDQLHY